MQIIIGADLVPTKSNETLFVNGESDKLLGKELLEDWNGSDIRIFNLETPLIESKKPIKKVGCVLGIDRNVVNGIKKLNPSFVALANNHIMDHDISGLNSTIDILKKNEIEYGGVGCNVKDANKVWIKELNGKRIGVYACTEHEFSIATENKPGANPFDCIDSYKCIEKSKKNCDFIIVLYHGGKEYYPYPSPNLQKICRNFIDKGADIVICQHSHCIGCEEDYNNKKIIYGQGDFLFDASYHVQRNHGLLLKMNIDKNSNYEMNYIVLTKSGYCTRKATNDEYKEIIQDYMNRSKEIAQDGFVKNNYRKYANECICSVFNKVDCFSNTLIGKGLKRMFKGRFYELYIKKYYLKKMSYKLANVIECEAWNELLKTIVDNYNN